MKKLLGLIVLGVLVYVAVTTAAAPETTETIIKSKYGRSTYVVKVTPGAKTNTREILGVLQKDATTDVVVLDACGTIIQVELPNVLTPEELEEIGAVVDPLVEKACE